MGGSIWHEFYYSHVVTSWIIQLSRELCILWHVRPHQNFWKCNMENTALISRWCLSVGIYCYNFSIAIKLAIFCSHLEECPSSGSQHPVKPERKPWWGIGVAIPSSQITFANTWFYLVFSWGSGMGGSICCPFTFSWPSVCISGSQVWFPWRNRSTVKRRESDNGSFLKEPGKKE